MARARAVVKAVGHVLGAFVRPWPWEPMIAAPMFLFFGLWTASFVVWGSSSGIPATHGVLAVLSVIAPVLVIYVVYAFARRYFGSDVKPPWIAYYAIVALCAVLAPALRYLFLGDSLKEYGSLQLWGLVDLTSPFAAFVRVVVSLLMFNAILGWFGQRLRGEVQRAEEALQLAQEQQRLLVAADEATRRQVAEHLHDRIQAALVLVGLQMKQVAELSEPATGDRLRSIADELEYIRGKQLHDVINGLSPEYSLVGLDEAVAGLSRRYGRALKVTRSLDPAITAMVEADQSWTEAVYRITEQALLNSARHGAATKATVRLDRAKGVVSLVIEDDGSGLPDAITPGLGTAITEAWVGQTRGRWSRIVGGSGGTSVIVQWGAPAQS